MKKRVLIVLGILLLAVLTACGKTEAPPPTATEDGQLLFGEVRQNFEGFAATPPAHVGNLPVVFEQNGLYGFKDKAGHVIVEPKYEACHGFERGSGSMRVSVKDINGQASYKWLDIDPTGHILEYDWVGNFTVFQNVLYGFSKVGKDGKFGFINTQWQEVVPLLYDDICYQYDLDNRIAYAYGLRDGKWVRLNMQEGYESDYQPFDPAKEAEYASVLDFSKEKNNLMVINDILLYKGHVYDIMDSFPIPLLPQVEMDVYDQGGRAAAEQPVLREGPYEGELQVRFPKTFGDMEFYYSQAEPYNYVAVPAPSNCYPRPVEELTDTGVFAPTLTAYLRDNDIANTPAAVTKAIQGDFFDTGVESAVIGVNDGYQTADWLESVPMQEDWTEQDFYEKKQAFVSSILLVRDVTKPEKYEVIAEDIWRHLDIVIQTQHIGFVADVDNDAAFELVIDYHGYEWRNFKAVDLPPATTNEH